MRKEMAHRATPIAARGSPKTTRAPAPMFASGVGNNRRHSDPIRPLAAPVNPTTIPILLSIVSRLPAAGGDCDLCDRAPFHTVDTMCSPHGQAGTTASEQVGKGALHVEVRALQVFGEVDLDRVQVGDVD